AGATAYGEGALSDWGALHLREQLHAAPALAAAGYAGFSTAMAVGRLAGGRLVAAIGERRLLVGGALGAGGAATTDVLQQSLPAADSLRPPSGGGGPAAGRDQGAPDHRQLRARPATARGRLSSVG